MLDRNGNQVNVGDTVRILAASGEFVELKVLAIEPFYKTSGKKRTFVVDLAVTLPVTPDMDSESWSPNEIELVK